MRSIHEHFGQPAGLVGRVLCAHMVRANRKRILWAVPLLDVQPSDRVLEVGFGPGVAIEQVARLARTGFVAGLDHSAMSVANAGRRNRAAIASGRVELRLGSVAALPYADASFDKVFSINSLQFWPQPVENLRGLRRVLRSGGRITLVSQPWWVRSDADVPGEGQRIAEQLAAAGFVRIRQCIQPMPTRSVVAVMGVEERGDV